MTDAPLSIRLAQAADEDAIWAIFHEVVAAGDTYAFAPSTAREEALRLWLTVPQATYVAARAGVVIGTYYLKPNQPGLGAHVCNAGYMVARAARGEGVGAALCAHSLEAARALGYHAMQYNLVVATNTGAIRLWEKMGFSVVGTLPEAFAHPAHGLVDALVLYRLL